MKHLIVTEDLNSLGIAEYDRVILDSITNEIVYMNGVKYEVIPDSYIYNETDHKYYQKLVAYGEPIEINDIDLNSQWVSDSEDNNYKYFKSNSNVGVGSSFSQCKVTWSNLTSITFKYMSSSEIGYDYLCVGKLDGEKFTAQPSDGRNNVYLSTKGKTSGAYYEFTIECDKGEHHIWFCYRKDSSGNQGEDRGFIGVPKSVVSVLDVKQGSELPTEYKSGGVSAESGKTYDVNFNSVILPNSSYIVPSYEDYTKTEKTINTEYVDLGLPNGTLWAKCNIGATTETDYGVYFPWGDISGISGGLVGKYSDKVFDWAHYKYCNGSSTTLTKYCTDSSYGTVDDKTTLEPTDDAASQIMGGNWRMPTAAEFQELYDNTTNEWVEGYNGSGVNGMKFTSKTNGKSIFFPASGRAYGTEVSNRGSFGLYWSSSLHPSNSSGGLSLYFFSGYIDPQYNGNRYYGFCVRSVLENLS